MGKRLAFILSAAVQLPLLVHAGVHGDVDVDGDSAVAHRVEMREVTVTADPRQVVRLEEQPVSYHVVDAGDLRRTGGMNGLKDAAAFVPNLYMPDYGSRLTSAIYIRGVGSRINTPAVGLYVDDVPYADKSAFDFSLADVRRIEVLRGPQSTLYGRNAMGGLLNVYTYNPLAARTEGRQSEVRIGAATEDAARYAQFRFANTVGADAAFSFSGFYKGSDGYNRNEFLNRRSNGGDSGGGKFRYVYNPLRHSYFTLDFQTRLEYSDEHGYDYYNVDDGAIRENELGGYRRTLLNSSLRLQTLMRPFVLTSVTAYQYLADRMFMDQDFTSSDIFTLTQRQRSHSLSEEIALKSYPGQRVEWTAGARFAYQWLKTDAPVDFGADGIRSVIQKGIDRGFVAANEAMRPSGMGIAMNVTDNAMPIDGLFDTPVLNAAAFGQATLKDFPVRRLDLTAGLRLDYEHTRMDYNSGAASNFDFRMTRGNRVLMERSFTAETRYDGFVRRDYTQFLPKAAVAYRFDDDGGLVYASVAKGFRSGGYNIQMFSDLIQTSLRNDMMRALGNDPQLGAAMSRYMQIGDNPAADSATVFKPETSWNYELGTRFACLDRHLNVQASAFYIRTRDQQIARFAQSGLGRQMVNAGESESYGAEVSLSGWCRMLRNVLTFNASYGYTHATFRSYDAGESAGESHVYDGNFVPFAPLHTLSLAAEYVVQLGAEREEARAPRPLLTVGGNLVGNGRVYWTEDNAASEPFYVLLGAHVGLRLGSVAVNVWGKNLADRQYVPFYFTSMSQGWAQTCRPRQFGVDVALAF